MYSSPVLYHNVPLMIGPPPVSMCFLFGDTQIWPGDLRVVGVGGLWFCCLMICPLSCETKAFHAEFLICSLAYWGGPVKGPSFLLVFGYQKKSYCVVHIFPHFETCSCHRQ